MQAATGGEDAFFVSDLGDGAVGVADGVSGWADDGVDPADYSRCALIRPCQSRRSLTVVLQVKLPSCLRHQYCLFAASIAIHSLLKATMSLHSFPL